MIVAHKLNQQYSKGFSLIELAVVIVIVGLIIAAIPLLVPNFSQLFNEKRSIDNTVLIEQNLKGFAITHSRLPCPDINDDGLEDCADAAQVGSVPYKTLNLANTATNTHGIPLQYGVYRAATSINRTDADLAVLKDRYAPVLPDGETSSHSNGLDFCWALRNAIQSANSALYPHVTVSGPLNQAFILADAGYFNADADAADNLFDGINATGVGFEDPQKPITSSYDDRVYSVGFHQLSGEIGCQALISHVNGSARAAYAAEDIYQLASFYADFRTFSLRVAEHNLAQAQFGVALATADLVIAAGNTASAIAAGIESFGVAAAATIAVAAVATGLAINAEISAVDAVIRAEADVAQEKIFRDNANAAKDSSSTFSTQKLLEAKIADENGWYQ